jgi:hypothetical protein
VSKTDDYRAILRTLPDWDAYLLQESGLPGPRGNIELARAVAEEGDAALFERFLGFDVQQAPTNSPHEFLAFCGVLGLGKLLANGQTEVLQRLRTAASDPRWRTREAVAMALQRWGDVSMDALLSEMDVWSQGTLLEQRAAAAALCEPRLLCEEAHAEWVLRILDRITDSLQRVQDRRQDAFRVLRKGLGYCWSVAVAAHPAEGKRMMERWLESGDPDVRWIMRENLKKKRLLRLDEDWVARCMPRVQRGGPR